VKSIVAFLLITSVICSQSYENVSSFQSTNLKLYQGVSEIFEWYDIPVGGAYFYRNYINPNNIGDKINLGPADFERQISDNYGISGNFSIGSMDKDLIPDILFYGGLAATYTSGLISQNSVDSRSFKRVLLFRKSLIYTYTLTEWVKNLVKRERPDGSNNRSFFSGHTATTFSAMTYLFLSSHELFDNWSVTANDEELRTLFNSATFLACYGWATYVGYSRIRDKKHYLSDVLTGAAVGTLVSYFLYDHYMADDSLPGMFELMPGRESLNLAVRVKL